MENQNKSSNSNGQNPTRRSWIMDNPFKVSALAVIVLWCLTPLFFLAIKSSRAYTLTQLGQIGDMYGTINSLFSGLTVAGLIYTIISQQKDLKDTKRQVRIQSYQRFDNLFFNRVELHRKAFKELPSGGQVIKRTLFLFLPRLDVETKYEQVVESLKSATEKNFLIHYAQYFMNYQDTINMIYEQKQTQKSRHKYVMTFLCQLNESELTLIFFYYTLKSNQSPKHFDNYKNILYTLLTHIPSPDFEGVISIIAKRQQLKVIPNLLV